jgi:hypothetical protein
LPCSAPARRNIARDDCEIYRKLRVIRLHIQGFRHDAVAWRERFWRSRRVGCSVGIDPFGAGSPTIGARSLCLIVMHAAPSIKTGTTMPMPA